jgi:hypothetical protein
MNRYQTTHNDWDPHLVIPFVVPRHRADKIYIDPTWGLRIDRVTADGKAVPPAPHRARPDDVNFNKTAIGADPFVYTVRRLSLVFAKSFKDAGEFELEKYTLPEKAKVVVIEYRLRESPDSVGPVQTLESNLV